VGALVDPSLEQLLTRHFRQSIQLQTLGGWWYGTCVHSQLCPVCTDIIVEVVASGKD